MGVGTETPVFRSWRFIIRLACLLTAFIQSLLIKRSPTELSTMPRFSQHHSLPFFCWKMEERDAQELLKKKKGLATVRAVLTKLRPFCLEKEKKRGRAQVSMATQVGGGKRLRLQINVGQKFPRSEQRNKGAKCPAEGPRA